MSKKAIISTATGVFMGAIVGFCYYKCIGCASGTCRITSKPLNCTLYFALIGGLALNMVTKETKTKK